ncbi:MAG: cytochrome c [Gammaproteobacteria bacterium]|nr:cytochrome c [Gammaproteobacteria bacterium]
MHNPVLKSKLSATLAAAILLASTTILADESFEKEIEYRQGAMNILSWNMKHIGGMLKGKTPYDAEKIKTHAADIASVASLNIMAGFPEDSTGEDSSALEDIWMDFENFEQKMADFKKAAKGMNMAAQSGDKAAVGKAMGALGKSCKGCHKPFKN